MSRSQFPSFAELELTRITQLVVDKPLRLLPRRRSDASYILRNLPSPSSASSKRSYKLNSRLDKSAVLVRKKEGYEKRIRQRCPRCEVQVGYEAGVGAGQQGACTYILHVRWLVSIRLDGRVLTHKGLQGALTEKQASAPDGALDDDPVASVEVRLRIFLVPVTADAELAGSNRCSSRIETGGRPGDIVAPSLL